MLSITPLTTNPHLSLPLEPIIRASKNAVVPDGILSTDVPSAKNNSVAVASVVCPANTYVSFLTSTLPAVTLLVVLSPPT